MYGTREIQFYHIVDKAFKHAYITVGFREGVILRGPPISRKRPKKLFMKRENGYWTS